MEKRKRGGARKGAGRKPIKDKKIAITLWIKKSTIKLYGGKAKFKKSVYVGLIE